jgi:hypothetical protein
MEESYADEDIVERNLVDLDRESPSGGQLPRGNPRDSGDAWAELRLEPCAVKAARTVLRGERVANDPDLLDKIRIYPTEEQLRVLWDLLEKYLLMYNFALSERIENWKEQKKKAKKKRNYITYTQQQNELLESKRKYPEYR